MNNKEVKKIISELKQTNKLYRRVIAEIVEDSNDHSGDNLQEKIQSRLRDISHGCQTGIVSSLIYYSDTSQFFRTYKKEIVELAEELATDIGEQVLTMIANFNPIKGDFTESEIAKVLYGPWRDTDYHQMIANSLAWFAYEEIANTFSNRMEE